MKYKLLDLLSFIALITLFVVLSELTKDSKIIIISLLIGLTSALNYHFYSINYNKRIEERKENNVNK